MKKYWSTLLALVVIVTCIGTYYISSVIEAKSYPEFYVQKLEGDESVIEPLVIGAYYEDDSKNGSIQMVHDKMVYRDHQSFFEQLKGVPFTYERRLQEQFPSLMRKAYYSGNNVYEDDQYVVFVHLIGDGYERQYEAMEVKVLMKETDEIETIMLDLELEDTNVWIRDVQMSKDEILVFTTPLWVEDRKQITIEQTPVYRFDIATSQFKEKSTLISREVDADHDVESIYKLGETPFWKPNEFIVFRKETEIDAANQHEQTNEINSDIPTEPLIGSELIVYEVETGKLEILVLPERFQHKEVQWFDGSNLYFADYQSDAVHVAVFNIRAEEISSEFSIANDPREGQSPLISVYDGYVYALDAHTNRDHHANLVVIDAGTGESVYQGEIIPKDDSQMEESFVLQFSNIYFRY